MKVIIKKEYFDSTLKRTVRISEILDIKKDRANTLSEYGIIDSIEQDIEEHKEHGKRVRKTSIQ